MSKFQRCFKPHLPFCTKVPKQKSYLQGKGRWGGSSRLLLRKQRCVSWNNRGGGECKRAMLFTWWLKYSLNPASWTWTLWAFYMKQLLDKTTIWLWEQETGNWVPLCSCWAEEDITCFAPWFSGWWVFYETWDRANKREVSDPSSVNAEQPTHLWQSPREGSEPFLRPLFSHEADFVLQFWEKGAKN